MALEPNGASKDRLPISARRAALRTLISAMFPDGFRADKLTPQGRQEVRDGIDAALVLYDDMKK